jgi:hypothetical protein
VGTGADRGEDSDLREREITMTKIEAWLTIAGNEERLTREKAPALAVEIGVARGTIRNYRTKTKKHYVSQTQREATKIIGTLVTLMRGT